MNWKDFLYFSPKERIGLLMLIVFIAGIFVGKWLFTPNYPKPAEEVFIAQGSAVEQAGNVFVSNNKHTATALPQSSSMNKPQRQDRETRTYYQQEAQGASKSSSPYSKIEKYPEGTVIELNAADTTELKMIPGIGSSYAKRIVGYRSLLGGYSRLEQLQEVYGMYVELYEKIIPYLYIDQSLLRKLPVNGTSLEQLKAHPYINFYQAKAIIETRKKQGRINSLEELSLLEEFAEEDWERIEPYLGFE